MNKLVCEENCICSNYKGCESCIEGHSLVDTIEGKKCLPCTYTGVKSCKLLENNLDEI